MKETSTNPLPTVYEILLQIFDIEMRCIATDRFLLEFDFYTSLDS